jgi:hypothetical protein
VLSALQDAQRSKYVGEPVLRKKLRTLVAHSGYSVLAPPLRKKLSAAFTAAGLHASPDIADPAVGQDSFLTISTHPIKPDAFLFAKEAELERFVEASLGVGAFKNLTLYQTDGRSGRQFRVGGQIIDLLCREALGPERWGLVAIELKRGEAPRGTLTQMVEYLTLLQKHFPGRPLRGIIVSSSEEAIDAQVLGEQALPFRIDWMRYKMSIEPVGALPAEDAANRRRP